TQQLGRFRSEADSPLKACRGAVPQKLKVPIPRARRRSYPIENNRTFRAQKIGRKTLGSRQIGAAGGRLKTWQKRPENPLFRSSRVKRPSFCHPGRWVFTGSSYGIGFSANSRFRTAAALSCCVRPVRRSIAPRP